jgi:hypothetical protein
MRTSNTYTHSSCTHYLSSSGTSGSQHADEIWIKGEEVLEWSLALLQVLMSIDLVYTFRQAECKYSSLEQRASAMPV